MKKTRNKLNSISAENSENLLDWFLEEIDSELPPDRRGRPAYTATQLRKEIIRRMENTL